jgi:hypothetical protein
MVHTLKTWPEFIDPLESGEKPFEIRKDDRNYQVGDILNLHEFDPVKQQYGKRFVIRQVTYVMRSARFGLKKGYCIMGLKPLFKARRKGRI